MNGQLDESPGSLGPGQASYLRRLRQGTCRPLPERRISFFQEGVLQIIRGFYANARKSLQKSAGKIAVFEDKKIRRIFHKGEWYFSIIDIVEVLTDSANARRYWSDLKIQLSEKEGFGQLYGKIVQLKMESSDGKKYLTDTANTETVFRIIQSIPSPKAEPFKRMRRIAIREELTDEWDQRGIKLQREYAILTAEISRATFGMTPSEYEEHKGLERENLRDHMTDLELIFSMLGEASTKEIAVNRDAQGFEENKNAAQIGGKIARNARLELEQESGKPVVSKANFLSRSKSLSLEISDET